MFYWNSFTRRTMDFFQTYSALMIGENVSNFNKTSSIIMNLVSYIGENRKLC